MDEAGSYSGHTFAETTKAAYRTHLRSYLRFCLKFDVDPIPANQFTLLAYIAFLARSLKPSSIGNYINIIRIIHLEANLKNPLQDNYAVSNLRKGISRVKGSPPNQKLPITCKLLYLILGQLNFCIPRDIVFWAACLIGFYGLFRKRTLLPIALANPGDACILRGDLFVQSDSFTVNVRKTKTIQCGERVLSVPFVACHTSPLCPVKALLQLLLVAPTDRDLPLFSFKQRGSIVWWTHSSFTNRLKELITRVGYDASRYSGHSFRRGGATLGFELGLSLTEIKHRGDWRSNAVNEYIVVSDVNHVADVMAKGSLTKL